MGRTKYKVTRTCMDCGDTKHITSHQPADIRRLCPLCGSKTGRDKAHETWQQRLADEALNVDDVVVQRLIDGIKVESTLPERMTAAAIMQLRGHHHPFIARRLGVSIRTLQRYSQTGNQA